MREQVFVVNGEFRRMIEAWRVLLPEEREQILYFAQHPEELKNVTRFEEIIITSPSNEKP